MFSEIDRFREKKFRDGHSRHHRHDGHQLEVELEPATLKSVPVSPEVDVLQGEEGGCPGQPDRQHRAHLGGCHPGQVILDRKDRDPRIQEDPGNREK